MSLKSLELCLRMEGCEVSRNFNLTTEGASFTTDELVEILGDSIVRGMNDKPDIIKGMLCKLFDEVEAKRKRKS